MAPGELVALLEKGHYPFRAWPRARCRVLLFPGCALPSQLPRTTDALVGEFRARGAGVAFDCCGLPLLDWRQTADAERVMAGLRARLARVGCEELVLACPNCLRYLRGPLAQEGPAGEAPVRCLSVYESLLGWGVRPRGALGAGVLFTPCPDRRSRELREQIERLLPLGSLEPARGVACCGLRADVARRGPEFVAGLNARLGEQASGRIVYTYCASCTGQFRRSGCAPTRHLLSVILGVDEEPDAAHAIANRARRKLTPRRELAPLPAGTSAKGMPCSR